MLEKIRSLIKRESVKNAQTATSEKEMIPVLMSMLENTQERELSCNEVFELLDQYAELIVNGEDAEQYMPLIKHHLEMCKDCNEEYESLLSILNAEKS